MEDITPQEMAEGSKPTRQEIIMNTSLEDVLAKDAWDDIDLEILVMNRHNLDQKTKDMLGIKEIKPLSVEEVAEQNETLKAQGTDAAPAKKKAKKASK